MEKAFNMCVPLGFMSMINTPAWMTMSSFEKLREDIIDKYMFINMAH